MTIQKKLIKHLSNIPGWRTRRKIVVIESDDWGSIRMPSLETFESLKAKGLDLTSGDASRYNLNDTLASAEDLAALFEVLKSVKDKNGRNAVFTPCCIVANPDFEKIEANDFQEYFYEPFTETLNRYKHENAFALWQQGIKESLFVPEFHGREHLNVPIWLRALQSNDSNALLAFKHQMWGFKNTNMRGISYQEAFAPGFAKDIDFHKNSIQEGLQLFNDLFGYQAGLLVPPNGAFYKELENYSAGKGIRFISKSKIQKERLIDGESKKSFYWLGKTNKLGQIYITRNVSFEPNYPGWDWIKSAMNDIEVAFTWNKPAILTTHRTNYIGSLTISNREHGLSILTGLLKSVAQKWPEVEFMSSAELNNLIAESRSK